MNSSYMNTDYLIRYISYRLHTIVKTWPHCAQVPASPQSFCARPDFRDDYLPIGRLYGFLEVWRTSKESAPENPTSGESASESLLLPSAAPLLFSVGRKYCYALVFSDETDFLIGPVAFTTPVHINRAIDNIRLTDAQSDAVPSCDPQDFYDLVLLVYNLLHPTTLTLDDLINANCKEESVDSRLMKELSDLVFARRENEEPHNPYDQELREFSSIEHGDIEMLRKSHQEDYPGKLGTLANDKIRHTRNLGIVVITLASRAAIRGGLSPEISFSMSDVFIQKLEEISDPAVLLNMVHEFEFQYTRMVAELNAQKAELPPAPPNPRIDKCKDYIMRHLHGKIYIQDIADHLYLNANYLSEIFHRQEGITITEYILKEKVNLTKNLLTYSTYTYSEIAAYLGFSSQSHLGKIFKKYTGTTLRHYRMRYGVQTFC